MTGRVLVGPFLTRNEAADLAGLEPDDVPFRPDLLRIGGHLLPEAYCRFQFGHGGIRSDIGTVVLAMRGEYDDLTIADWLVRGNLGLRGSSPLEYLNRTHAPAAVLEALLHHPPSPPAGPGAVPAPAARRAAHRTTAAPRPRIRTRRIGQPATSH